MLNCIQKAYEVSFYTDIYCTVATIPQFHACLSLIDGKYAKNRYAIYQMNMILKILNLYSCTEKNKISNRTQIYS